MNASRWTAVFLAALVLGLALAAGVGAEVVQKGTTRVKFEGQLIPKALPRSGEVPVHVSVAAHITALKKSDPPKLKRISIAINSAGRFSPSVVPICTIRDIQPSTTQNALKACGDSLVGTGQFAAKVLFQQQASFPSVGKLYAFNGRYQGHPAILAHVYGTEPVPTSFTLPFVISKRKGELGTVLTASLSEITGKAGYITLLSLDLGRTIGKRSYLSASCPTPKGIGSASFPFAKANFDFGSSTLQSTLIRTCKANG
jgi:hypothetical protein